MKCCLPHFELSCPPIHWSSNLNLLIYWYLKFRIDGLLVCKKTDKVEQLDERSAGQAHAGKLFTFCSLCKLHFTSWLFVVVSEADKNLEVVQNWLRTTLKHRKTWWNWKPLRSLFTKLTWACSEVPSSSLRTSLSSTALIFDHREY